MMDSVRIHYASMSGEIDMTAIFNKLVGYCVLQETDHSFY